MTTQIVDERSFRLGIKYARDVIINGLADLSDEQFIFRSAVENISDYLCMTIEESIDSKDILWGGEPILFEGNEQP